MHYENIDEKQKSFGKNSHSHSLTLPIKFHKKREAIDEDDDYDAANSFLPHFCFFFFIISNSFMYDDDNAAVAADDENICGCYTITLL